MMLRVRPPQLTITVVSGEGVRSAKRYTISAPGTLTAPGILLPWELFVGARVEDRDIGAVVDQLFQILRGNPWCRRLMFDDFREGLAGNMDAAIDVKTGFLPAGDAAFQKAKYRNTQVLTNATPRASQGLRRRRTRRCVSTGAGQARR